MPNQKPPSPSRQPAVQGERPPRLKFPMRVRRIRLHYKEKQWKTLVDIIIDSKTLRQSPELPPGPRSGFWYELRDRRGRLLYWRKLANPFSSSLELFEPDGSIQRVPFERKDAFVEVLIPDLPEAAELQIFSDTSPDGKEGRYATKIRMVTLGDDDGYRKKGKEEDHGRQ